MFPPFPKRKHKLRNSFSSPSKVELRTDFGEVPSIVAFAGEVRQVFSNLLTNAIDAAAGARIEIRLRHARDRSGRKGVKVLIADRGAIYFLLLETALCLLEGRREPRTTREVNEEHGAREESPVS